MDDITDEATQLYESLKYNIVSDDKGLRYYDADGNLHREDGPAKITGIGCTWYNHGVKHRSDGPACVNIAGDKEWWINGERHREDGPAVHYSDGHKQWRINGVLHRTDGPAVDSGNGFKFWYIDGVQLSEEEFNERIKSIQQSI